MKVTRSEFLKLVAFVIGTGGAIAACGDENTASSPGPGGGNGDGSAPPGPGGPDGSSPTSDGGDAGGKRDSGDGIPDSGDRPDTGGGNNDPPDSGGNNPKSCTDNGAGGTVGFAGGHSHPFANIAAVDFANITTEQTYLLANAGGHTHELTLTVAELTMLKNGQSVTKASTTDSAHSHSVTVTCL
ncbi:MAG: hypothetical protein K0S65_2006 [Labilithrix sp.]|nr:hypothetical protein [Labilithrix sp.]